MLWRMSRSLVIKLTAGADAPERCSQAFTVAATAVAVELAVLNNFMWHQRWTWSDRPSATKKETWRRLVKFNVTTGLVSLVGNLALMSILVGRFHLPITPANVITVAACSVLSFFLADRIAFDVATAPLQNRAR